MLPDLSRRQLLRAVAAGVAAVPLLEAAASADPTAPTTPVDARSTLEAFADTIVPGEHRFRGDRVVAGAARGPGAVQAGAWRLLNDPAVGIGPGLPALAAALDAEAVGEAGRAGLVLDPTVAPFVALPFGHRTALATRLLGGTGQDQVVWYALAAIAMLAFHTAAHLDTADAVRRNHPGLAWLGFPQPDADGLWRYEHYSYRRRLAHRHPRTTATGSPA
ncbi:MAG: DUF5987 family protein [Nocardioidaceae bacterium]